MLPSGGGVLLTDHQQPPYLVVPHRFYRKVSPEPEGDACSLSVTITVMLGESFPLAEILFPVFRTTTMHSLCGAAEQMATNVGVDSPRLVPTLILQPASAVPH